MRNCQILNTVAKSNERSTIYWNNWMNKAKYGTDCQQTIICIREACTMKTHSSIGIITLHTRFIFLSHDET